MMLPSKHGRVCVYDMVMMHNFVSFNFVVFINPSNIFYCDYLLQSVFFCFFVFFEICLS
jgi:hypothetical protein